MKKLIAYVDGGSRGNPGPAAIGIYKLHDDGRITTHSECIGEATNNVAEYMALYGAVCDAVHGEFESLHVFSDSELMVNQIKGQYIVRNERLKQIYDSIIQKLPKLKEFHITHIPREQNKEADRLVNEVLDAVVRSNVRKGTRKDSIFQRKLPSVQSA